MDLFLNLNRLTKVKVTEIKDGDSIFVSAFSPAHVIVPAAERSNSIIPNQKAWHTTPDGHTYFAFKDRASASAPNVIDMNPTN